LDSLLQEFTIPTPPIQIQLQDYTCSWQTDVHDTLSRAPVSAVESSNLQEEAELLLALTVAQVANVSVILRLHKVSTQFALLLSPTVRLTSQPSIASVSP